MNNKLIASERHQKALDYALEAIRRSPVFPYVEAVYLYGSCARGEEAEKSDLDLFVELQSRVLEDDALRRDSWRLEGDVCSGDYTLPDVQLRVVFGNAWRTNPMLFYTLVRDEGICCFANEGCSEAHDTGDSIDTYLESAVRDFEAFGVLFEVDRVSPYVAWHAHLVCEKCLKHLMEVGYSHETKERKMVKLGMLRSGSLVELMDFLKEELGVVFSEDVASAMAKISHYSEDMLYPGWKHGEMTLEDMNVCNRAVRGCLEETKALVGQLEQARGSRVDSVGRLVDSARASAAEPARDEKTASLKPMELH